MGNDNGNPTTLSNLQPEGVSTTLQILISWDQMSGQVSVQGQFVNKVVAYGMLDMAKEVLKAHFDQNQGKIVLPSGVRVTTRTVS